MNPKISIIIPVFNAEKYLEECLNSVINQSLKDIEIICVDDGSTDKSPDILKKYSSDSRIKIIRQKNKGQGCARNNALDIAKGDYIQFVDADDWIEINTCEKLYKKATTDNLDLLIFQALNYDDNNDKFYEDSYYNNSKLPHEYDEKIFSPEDVSEYMFSIAVTPVSKLYKRSLIEKFHVRFPVETFFEDNPFHWETFLISSKISIIREHLYIRRRHDTSTTSNINERYFETVAISNEVVNVFKKYDLFDKYKKEVINNKITYLLQWYKNMEESAKQEYKNLLNDDFNEIKKDKKLYEDYVDLLNESNKPFFINVTKTKSVEELDLKIKEYKMKKQYKYDMYKISLKETEFKKMVSEKEEKLGLMKELIDTRYEKLNDDQKRINKKQQELLGLEEELKKKSYRLEKQIKIQDELLEKEEEKIKKLNKELDSKIKKLENINLEKDKIINNKNIEINKLKKFRNDVNNSTSWKITKPLRSIKKLF